MPDIFTADYPHITFDFSGVCLSGHPLFADHIIATGEDVDEVYCSNNDHDSDVPSDYNELCTKMIASDWFHDNRHSRNTTVPLVLDNMSEKQNKNAARLLQFMRWEQHCWKLVPDSNPPGLPPESKVLFKSGTEVKYEVASYHHWQPTRELCKLLLLPSPFAIITEVVGDLVIKASHGIWNCWQGWNLH